jgi:phage terminase large subunit
MRGKKQTKKQIYLTFNPIDSMSWLRERFFDGDQPKEDNPTATVMHSTYKDNEFLNDADYEAELESLEGQDENLHNIYALGLWGMLKNLFYTKWHEVADADWPAKFDELFYGLDFGDAHPMVLLEIGLIEDAIYERELLFESRVPVDEITVRFDDLEVDKEAAIYADPSRPDLIRLIEDGGYNIHPADNDVKAGIALVQTKCPNIHGSSQNYLRQRKAYKRKEDRNGNVYDWVPVKVRDDGPDAERYGLYTYFSEMDLIPNVLGRL